ncbi:MAG: hypothetical protein H6739_39890 [Alphaproteobacteria bacterium]|nr:hypothetical protein [Alphaproteobacteria bacterium]
MTPLLLLPLLPASLADDVVVFGDSWAEGAADELADVLQLNGRSDITVDGQGVGGTTADGWAANPSALPDAVSLNPDARWVWLSIGGNDLFQHYLQGYGGSTATDYDADLRVMLDSLFAAHPDIEVVMFGYDFINFEQSTDCILTAWAYFGTSITTPTLNQYFIDQVMGTIEDVAADYPRLTYVDSVLGTLQEAGGVAGAPNVLFPSPSRYMSDCIHPNHDGYLLIMQALYDDYWGRSAPTAAMSPEGGAYCVDETAVFTGVSGGAAEQHWYMDGAHVGEGSTLELAFDAPGSHTLEIEARNGAWVDSVTATVEVSAVPVAEAGADATICPGESVSLGAAPEDGAAYDWAPTAGLDDPTSSQPLATPTETTTYTVTATAGEACAATDAVTVTVLPVEELTLDGPNVALTEEAVTFSVDAAGPVTWDVEGATPTVSEDGLEATVVWEAVGTYQVTVISTPAEGCPAEVGLLVEVSDDDDVEADDSGVDPDPGTKDAACGGCSGSRTSAGWALGLLGLMLALRRRAR